MAFRKKWPAILPLQPDVLILQECEHPSRYKASEWIPNHNEFLWFGQNPNKGVGVISFGDYHVQSKDHYQKAFTYIIPLHVFGSIKVNLFAIWAMPHASNDALSYVGQIWQAVQYYQADFQEPSILIGDWNSNPIWDASRKTGNHSDLIEYLEAYQIRSVYHLLTQEKPGEESMPTLYLLKQRHKPYHIDYCFASANLIQAHTEIRVGEFEQWIQLSDHMPLEIMHLSV